MLLNGQPTNENAFGISLSQSSLTWTLQHLLMVSAVPVLLLLSRVLYSGRITYSFLLWNLFLAWLPLLLAYLSLRSLPRRPLLALIAALAWLAFFPNAPYILTDIMHLRYDDGITVLFDVLLLFTFAISGITLGFVSLRWMQVSVARRIGMWWSRGFAVMVLGLSGFGIYLGRFLRWNSWDIVTNPLSLAQDIWPRLMHPIQHWHTWAMSVLFAFVLIFIYYLLVILPRMAMGEMLDAE